jgi:hypothetical protein
MLSVVMSARKAMRTKEVEKKKKVIFTTIIQLGLFFVVFPVAL